jgi:(2Fe-2S) ferredoxin
VPRALARVRRRRRLTAVDHLGPLSRHLADSGLGGSGRLDPAASVALHAKRLVTLGPASWLAIDASKKSIALREEQGRRLLTNVKVVATGCMEGCLAGPALLVVPDNVWYGGVTEADVPELVEQHLIGGKPVELLRIGPEDFCG